MNATFYHPQAIHPDHQADRWFKVQQHIRELHSFLAGASHASPALSASAFERAPIAAAPQEIPIAPAVANAEQRRTLLDRYLQSVAAACGQQCVALPNAAAHEQVALDRVFVTLDLATTSAGDAPQSVFAGLRQHRHLILLGPDGSGKSTTLRFLAATMAAAISAADQPHNGLPQLEGWRRGPRLPIRVDLAAALAAPFNAADPLAMLWAGVPELAQLDLDPAQRELLCATLSQTLERGQGLLLIDGLEQVPSGPAFDQAQALISLAHERFATSYMLITYRSDDYSCPAYRLDEIESAGLAPLSQHQLEVFVGRWYRALAAEGRYDLVAAQARARSFCTLLRRQPALAARAATPQQLAVMLLVHGDQGQLPAAAIKHFWLSLN